MKSELYNFSGKTALVTGGSNGIGFAAAKSLSDQGANIILVARDVNKLEEASSQIKNSLYFSVDISNKDSVKSLFNEIENQNIKLDICLNSAGIFQNTDIFSEDDDSFEKMFNVNLIGAWNIVSNTARHMKKNQIHGSIINISSVAGHNYIRDNVAAYASSKAALSRMTEALACELAREKIRINNISPGLVHTDLNDYRLNTEELRSESRSKIPLNMIAKPADISPLILYLSSNEASKYVTGSTFTIDGGSSLA